MKNTNRKIPPCIARCLWSFDLNNFDLERYKELLITQVLNYSDWPGVKWLYKTYSEEDIKDVIKHPRHGLWFCRFWSKPAIHSGAKLPSVLEQTCHPFWLKVYHFLGKYQNEEHSL